MSMSDDQGQSAKLALIEARVELDELRRTLVEANADRSAARLEQKAERDMTMRAAERHEKIVYDLRREIETVRESLEAEVAVAEDAAHAAMEKARKREKDLQAELATARGAVETAAASTLQRVCNKRWTRVLQERYHTAHAQAEAAEAEHARLKDELEESQRALQSSAARTLQRALMGKMGLAVRAAGGDVEAMERLKEERRLADVRQLEQEQAGLRTALNESRRRAARLEKRLQQADGGAMLVATTIKNIFAGEVVGLERDRDEVIGILEERLSQVRRRMINLSLKLSAAQAKARVSMNRVSDAESALYYTREHAEKLEERVKDAEGRRLSCRRMLWKGRRRRYPWIASRDSSGKRLSRAIGCRAWRRRRRRGRRARGC